MRRLSFSFFLLLSPISPLFSGCGFSKPKDVTPAQGKKPHARTSSSTTGSATSAERGRSSEKQKPKDRLFSPIRIDLPVADGIVMQLTPGGSRKTSNPLEHAKTQAPRRKLYEQTEPLNGNDFQELWIATYAQLRDSFNLLDRLRIQVKIRKEGIDWAKRQKALVPANLVSLTSAALHHFETNLEKTLALWPAAFALGMHLYQDGTILHETIHISPKTHDDPHPALEVNFKTEIGLLCPSCTTLTTWSKDSKTRPVCHGNALLVTFIRGLFGVLEGASFDEATTNLCALAQELDPIHEHLTWCLTELERQSTRSIIPTAGQLIITMQKLW